jgi:hypothetical protein
MLERRFASLLEDRNAVAVRNERREFFSKLSMPHCKYSAGERICEGVERLDLPVQLGNGENVLPFR